MRNRKEDIMGIARAAFLEQFHKSSQSTAQFCENHKREIVSGFLNAFESAMSQAYLLQDRYEKDKIKYLQFSHLYSSMFLRTYLIRMDVLDAGFYSDRSGAVTYWNAECIYRLFEDDIQEIRKVVETGVPRIREYEVDDIRYAYAPYYHRMTKVFLETLLEEILEDGRFRQEENRWAEIVRILYGEYMGQADILFTLHKGDKTNEIF